MPQPREAPLDLDWFNWYLSLDEQSRLLVASCVDTSTWLDPMQGLTSESGEWSQTLNPAIGNNSTVQNTSQPPDGSVAYLQVNPLASSELLTAVHHPDIGQTNLHSLQVAGGFNASPNHHPCPPILSHPAAERTGLVIVFGLPCPHEQESGPIGANGYMGQDAGMSSTGRPRPDQPPGYPLPGGSVFEVSQEARSQQSLSNNDTQSENLSLGTSSSVHAPSRSTSTTGNPAGNSKRLGVPGSPQGGVASIYFRNKSGKVGIRAIDVFDDRYEDLAGKNKVANLGQCGTSMSVVIEHPGYKKYRHQFKTHNWRKPPKNVGITMAKLSKEVAKCLNVFNKKAVRQVESIACLEVALDLGKTFIIGLRRISRGSWNVILSPEPVDPPQ